MKRLMADVRVEAIVEVVSGVAALAGGSGWLVWTLLLSVL